MQMPVGLIADHWGLKKSLLMGPFIVFIGYGIQHIFLGVLLYRLIMGFGASFGLSACWFRNEWMPESTVLCS